MLKLKTKQVKTIATNELQKAIAAQLDELKEKNKSDKEIESMLLKEAHASGKTI